jgi:mono/diheme cytochrome c family protein
MRRLGISLFSFVLTCLSPKPSSGGSPNDSPKLHQSRQSASDLEVGGDLSGLPQRSTRYLTRKEILALPQVTYTVTDDPNFTGPTKISGVELAELLRRFGTANTADMVVAICDDKYRANYPQDYLVAHHPVLVLSVNGRAPAGWPKDAQDHKYDMGPYMISHPKFAPGFKILSHTDEAQIPWGVIRLEFRDEKTVFGAIAPRGMLPQDARVQAGFRIAQQNCFRCHNAGREGGQQSGRSWADISALAVVSPEDFASYVRNPQASNPHAKMPGNPAYDDETLGALAAYFRTFSAGTSQ